jgi:hypothetical protein
MNVSYGMFFHDGTMRELLKRFMTLKRIEVSLSRPVLFNIYMSTNCEEGIPFLRMTIPRGIS